jgi:hypothetical protein
MALPASAPPRTTSARRTPLAALALPARGAPVPPNLPLCGPRHAGGGCTSNRNNRDALATWRCQRCGDILAGPYRTCRDYADALARQWGDLLTADQADQLLLLRLLCRISEALQTGAEEIGEP